MNQEQLNVIKERVAKATSGPWESEETTEGHIDIFNPNQDYAICQTGNETYDCLNEGDTEFIKHAITDVPALIAEVEYLREMLRDTRKIVRHKVSEVKTLQNACKKHKAKQEALEFQLKVSIMHAEELDEELEAEVAENEQLREIVKEFIDYWATTKDTRPLLEIVTDARQALGGEADE